MLTENGISVILRCARFATPVHSLELGGSIAQLGTGSYESPCMCVYQQQRRLCVRPQQHSRVTLASSRCTLSYNSNHMIMWTLPVLFQLSILQEQPRKDAGDIALSSPSPSSSSCSSMLTPTSAGLFDPSVSCPGTPSTQHSKMAAMQGVGCPSPVATLKRPTALSRHTSAAGVVQKVNNMSCIKQKNNE